MRRASRSSIGAAPVKTMVTTKKTTQKKTRIAYERPERAGVCCVRAEERALRVSEKGGGVCTEKKRVR